MKFTAMFESIKELFSLLTPAQRKRFYLLQLLVILMAVFEIIGVASMAPFMALIGDMSLVKGDGLLANAYMTSGLQSPESFVFGLGVIVLVFLSLSTLISMFTIWRLSLFATRAGTEIADRLYQHYMRQDWLFHANGSTSQFTKQIANESQRVTSLILQPLMQMNARIVLALAMSIAVFIYNPQVAVVGLVVFFVAYWGLYRGVRKKLQVNGKVISEMLSERYRLMNEGFGGIKDILILGRDESFIDRFHRSGERLASSAGTNVALSQTPRYFMELVSFGSIIALVLFLFKFYDGDIGSILPVLSVYALAGLKLLPAYQNIYISIAQIKGNLSALESIREDLKSASYYESAPKVRKISDIALRQTLELKDICFTYPSKNTPTLNKLSLKIKVNSVVGVVGASGSGKSTAIDVLLGLIKPNSGQLLIDGEEVVGAKVHAWQSLIGFVPQAIYLSEGSIAENVAFGLSKARVENEKVRQAIKMAHLNEFVETLPKGIETAVGERGVQLSGGQRQRIGIARALYHNPSVLVFDEATSALDGITEKIIMDTIHDFYGTKTIIMIAHRLKTVKSCDEIFLIEDGQVVERGGYEKLYLHNPIFRKMADHS